MRVLIFPEHPPTRSLEPADVSFQRLKKPPTRRPACALAPLARHPQAPEPASFFPGRPHHRHCRRIGRLQELSRHRRVGGPIDSEAPQTHHGPLQPEYQMLRTAFREYSPPSAAIRRSRGDWILNSGQGS